MFLGQAVPAGMTPEQALIAKKITPAQFTDIKNNLPSGVSWQDYLNVNVVNPTLDVVATPITSTLQAVADIGTTARYALYAVGAIAVAMLVLPMMRRRA